MIRQKEKAPLAPAPEQAALINDIQCFFRRADSEFKNCRNPARCQFTTVRGVTKTRCFRALGLPVIFCVFGSYAQDGCDLPCWLK